MLFYVSIVLFVLHKTRKKLNKKYIFLIKKEA